MSQEITKNTHTIPRLIIKQWATTGEHYTGVHVYESTKNKSSFSSSKGQRGYSFAIEEYLYVPLIEDERVNSIEDWLDSVEGTLDFTINNIKAGDNLMLRDKESFHKLLLALFSLLHRSNYDLEINLKHLSDNPELLSTLSPDKIVPHEIAILQNLINATTDHAYAHANCHITIGRNESGNLILSDRPFLYQPFRQKPDATLASMIALSPYFFLSITPTNQVSKYSFAPIDDKLVDMMNKYVAANSRYWIVAKDKETLEKYIDDCGKHSENDKPDIEVPKHITTGSQLSRN